MKPNTRGDGQSRFNLADWRREQDAGAGGRSRIPASCYLLLPPDLGTGDDYVVGGVGFAVRAEGA
jgi:hypothetical protein